MQAFKKLSTAAQHAQPGEPIVRVGDLYVVGMTSTTDEIAVLRHEPSRFAERGCWTYAGHVNVGHLERLGNANWAIANNGADRADRAKAAAQ
jgi:hypothetical protein